MSALVFVLLLVALPQNGSTDSPPTIQRRAHDEYERHKQAAIRINERAGRINSEGDASAVVSEIAGLFAKEPPSRIAMQIHQQKSAHVLKSYLCRSGLVCGAQCILIRQIAQSASFEMTRGYSKIASDNSITLAWH